VRVSEAVARNRSTQISFSTLADSDLAVREAAFELCVIENLGAFDAVSILRKTHRALGPRGVAIAACPNPEAAFPLLPAGNPSATVEVRVAPDGTIVGRKLVTSSGVAAWDETVLRAIDKTEVLPRDVDGRVPPTITIAFRPLE